jgi:hypothetical protein
MAVDRYKPHLLVLPEDDYNLQMANGFHLHIGRLRQMQVLPIARGWPNVLSLFEKEHITGMNNFRERFMVLLVDFDRDESRLEKVKAAIPAHLAERVFVLGIWSEPEDLKPEFGSCETIGVKIAEDCHSGTETTVGHELLRHNAPEFVRLRREVFPILFPPA